jgi:hypothetical protein
VTRTPRTSWLVWLSLPLALLLLNTSVTFENVWPTPKVRWAAALSVELAACVLVLVVSHRWARQVSRHVLPVLWLLLVAGHYLDVTAPGLYGRDFNLYWDSQHLGNVAAMLARAAPAWMVALTAVGAVVAVAAVYGLARLAFGTLGAAVSHRRPRRVLGAVAGALLLGFVGQQFALAVPGLIFAEPVSPTYVRQARFVVAMFGPQAVASPLGASPDLRANLDGLGGADVLVIFVESYGAVAYETPEIADQLLESRAVLAAAVRETGREVSTAYLESPTTGASSWLAHLSLMSGVEVRDQYAYSALMASDRETIVTNFSRRGYRTVALMPGMRQPWPEGSFYGFDVIYGRAALEYDGPEFGWWSIPDQYALAKLDVLERAPGPRAPVFVVFPTSTPHAPFGPVAPYQPDWSRVLTTTAFEEDEVERALAMKPDLTNLRPSYVRAIAYDFRTLAGYLRAHPGDDFLMIALGDHQPPAAVSGPDVPWSVPVHVIGRRGVVMDRLREKGFRPGLDPVRPSISPLHVFTATLLQAFGPV